MAFFDDIGKKIGSAAEKAKEAANLAADKAKDTVEITKLNSAIAAEEKNIAQYYAEIGKIYYDLEKNNPAGPAAEQCAAISAALANIEENKARIIAIKEDEDLAAPTPTAAPTAAAVTETAAAPPSKKFCTECGTANGAETKFCQNCGHPLA